MGKKFTDFINKMDEAAKNKKNGFNPADRIDKYKKLVNSLYDDINTWLSEEIESGKILTGTVPINLTEDFLGSYSVDEKWIQIGNARILFHPVGTLLIGTDARVDMVYGAKDVMIVRVGENVESPYNLTHVEMNGEPAKKKKSHGKSVWKYVNDASPLTYIKLDKDRFEDLIINIVDGDR